jgi:hypothetical protein
VSIVYPLQVVTYRKFHAALQQPQRLCSQFFVMADQDALHLATATAASVQALAAALQQNSLQPGLQTKVTLPPFWPQDPTAWFQHIEAELIIARVPLTRGGILHRL